MNRFSIKGLMLAVLITSILISCDSTKGDDTSIPLQFEKYGIPDSLLNETTKQLMIDFNNDNSIVNKTAMVKELNKMNIKAIILHGVKEKHLWCKIIDTEQGNVVSEYLSPDIILNSYSWDIGYGEKDEVVFYNNPIEVCDYMKNEDAEIMIWHINSSGGCVHKFEFNKDTDYKAYYDNPKDLDFKYQFQEVAWSVNSLLFRNKCFNYAGDTLYTIRIDIMVQKIKNDAYAYAFVSPEDIVHIEFYGAKILIERFSLIDCENIWSRSITPMHTMTDHAPRCEYSIVQKQGNEWEFQCIATSYSGTKVKYTTVVDVNNPPSELSITEEEL